MTTYSDKSFNSNHYNSARPTYPDRFYQTLVEYHKKTPGNATQLAVDVGCGPGFATFKLADYFDRVIGTDLSSTMIDECKGLLAKDSHQNMEFYVAPAEQSPPEIEPESVDMVTGAECCHWLDHPKFFAECARILKPGGTLAYWFYLDLVFVNSPEATDLHMKYSYGSSADENSEYEKYFGPYYQQPGHDIFRDAMTSVPIPDTFDNVVRHYYHPFEHPSDYTTLYIERKVDLNWYLGYAKSWSGYHKWVKENPGRPDAAEELVARVQKLLGVDMDTELKVVFPTIYYFARKK